MQLFKCEKCGQIVRVIKKTNADLVCCGQPMTEITANTVDAAQEKHVPVVVQDGNAVKVNVGEVDHPMLEEHYIEWIYLETSQGAHRKVLNPGDKPSASFVLSEGEELKSVYCYCNLHGLWKA